MIIFDLRFFKNKYVNTNITSFQNLKIVLNKCKKKISVITIKINNISKLSQPQQLREIRKYNFLKVFESYLKTIFPKNTGNKNAVACML